MKESLPLVSILIPAYNKPQYLEKALVSALNQTYTNIEIVICDDSTNNEVEKMLKDYMKEYKNIKYYNNGGPMGKNGILNCQKCFDLSNGEYINYLFHDDLFYPSKIEIMLKYLISNKDVTLVTSCKKFIDKNGIYLSDGPALVEKNSKIDRELIGAFMLNNMANVVGEPTAGMFRKSDIEDEIFSYKGRIIRGFGDMAIWLKLLSKGHLIYIREPLSCFRIHDKQSTYDPIVQLWGAIDWYYLITNSYLNKNFIKSKEQYLKIIEKWFNDYIGKIKELQSYLKKDDENLRELRKDFYYCYVEAIKSLLEL